MMRRKNANAATEEIARALFLEEDILPLIEKKNRNFAIRKSAKSWWETPTKTELKREVGFRERSWR